MRLLPPVLKTAEAENVQPAADTPQSVELINPGKLPSEAISLAFAHILRDAENRERTRVKARGAHREEAVIGMGSNAQVFSENHIRGSGTAGELVNGRNFVDASRAIQMEFTKTIEESRKHSTSNEAFRYIEEIQERCKGLAIFLGTLLEEGRAIELEGMEDVISLLSGPQESLDPGDVGEVILEFLQRVANRLSPTLSAHGDDPIAGKKLAELMTSQIQAHCPASLASPLDLGFMGVFEQEVLEPMKKQVAGTALEQIIQSVLVSEYHMMVSKLSLRMMPPLVNRVDASPSERVRSMISNIDITPGNDAISTEHAQKICMEGLDIARSAQTGGLPDFPEFFLSCDASLRFAMSDPFRWTSSKVLSSAE